MRFFTRSWSEGELSDAEFEAAISDYRDHVATLLDRLSAPLRRLATDLSMHDAIVKNVQRAERSLSLSLRVGDRQRGYFDLDLRYEDVSSLRGMAAVGSEVLQDEVDIDDDGAFVHRFLFDVGEMVVSFRDVTLHAS
ncbi:MAG: DUF4085 family protein [Acidobacteria bacterium]|nr:DUF4085 family protein [Acidobacteriota bacterium]